jgi:hypothetical protein
MPERSVFEFYDKIRENTLSQRRFKQSDILPLIEKRDQSLFSIEKLGKSYEEREIFLLKSGTGNIKIAVWSQMHGNEPTGTQALFDVFNFLENPREFSTFIETVLKKCTLYFLPMLNPDGAERFQRRNAQDIDINRDALKLASPEGRLLNGFIDEVKPDFGFNLHDQDIWYSAGNGKFPATLSFLTPSFNIEKDLDKNRIRSMRLIASMHHELTGYIPRQMARYSDDFMPSAFGDQIQKNGVATVLIESGGYHDDPEKQMVRRLNFLALVHAFKVISAKTFEKEALESYLNIPFNVKNKLFDYVLRNIEINGKHGIYRTDIGIRSQQTDETDKYVVDDIGDLSNYFGYKERSGINVLEEIKIGHDATVLINRYFHENNH